MKLFIRFLLFLFCSACHAKSECIFTTKNISFPTPTTDDVANTYWQDDKDGYETIKRLFISYKDGSTAVIEHKFCSMYNFEVAYYAKDKEKLKNPDDVYKATKSLFAYSAMQDSTLSEAIEAMNKDLREKNFSYTEKFFSNHDDANEKSQNAEFHLKYLSMEFPAFHEAALYIYMGIGGMH